MSSKNYIPNFHFRSLPDFRGDWCRSSYPSDEPGLPKTSIIICFYNEAWYEI